MNVTAEVKDNTPAGRLFHLLTALRARQRKEQSRDAVAAVFGVDRDDLPELFRHCAAAASAAVEAKRLLQDLPADEDPGALLLHFGQVETVIERLAQFGGTTETEWLLGPLDEAGMLTLRVAAARLSARCPEPAADADRVRDLLDKIGSLLEDVHAMDDLDDETKAFTLDLLLKIERTLKDVRFLGIRPVENAFNETIGTMRRKPNLLARLATSKAAARFGQILVGLDLLLNLAANATGLLDGQASPAVVEILPDTMVPSEFAQLDSTPWQGGAAEG